MTRDRAAASQWPDYVVVDWPIVVFGDQLCTTVWLCSNTDPSKRKKVVKSGFKFSSLLFTPIPASCNHNVYVNMHTQTWLVEKQAWESNKIKRKQSNKTTNETYLIKRGEVVGLFYLIERVSREKKTLSKMASD